MGYTIAKAESRLVRIPIEPPRGDAIQQFNALELPIVTITDGAGRVGIGFGYTIGAGGSSILELLRAQLLDWLIGQDARRIAFIHEHLNKSIEGWKGRSRGGPRTSGRCARRCGNESQIDDRCESILVHR